MALPIFLLIFVQKYFFTHVWKKYEKNNCDKNTFWQYLKTKNKNKNKKKQQQQQIKPKPDDLKKIPFEIHSLPKMYTSMY